ncbi:MAG: hypothetical protein ABIX19_16945 [Gemmatimonadaceae bacterium]
MPPPDPDRSQYETTWFDRAGPDAGIRLRAIAYASLAGGVAFLGIAFMAAQAGGRVAVAAIPLALFVGVLLGVATYFAAIKLTDGVGALAKAFTLPSGNSTPYEQTYSFQESLAVRGDVAGALESYEAIIAENPGAVAPRLKAAEHYAKGNRDAKRASELFREVREIPECTTRDAIYASTRLVDLYDGPLNDPGRAIVELRRIIELYPGSTMAKHARTALPALKARMQTGET